MRLRGTFVEGSAWRLSKVVTDSTETKWIGAPKKIVVDLKKSQTEKVADPDQCARVATVMSCKLAVMLSSRHVECDIFTTLTSLQRDAYGTALAVTTFCLDPRWQMLLL